MVPLRNPGIRKESGFCVSLLQPIQKVPRGSPMRQGDSAGAAPPASRQDTLDRRGIDVKVDCTALKVGAATRGHGAMHAMPCPEYDPIIPANSTLHQSDCPPNQLNSSVARVLRPSPEPTSRSQRSHATSDTRWPSVMDTTSPTRRSDARAQSRQSRLLTRWEMSRAALPAYGTPSMPHLRKQSTPQKMNRRRAPVLMAET